MSYLNNEAFDNILYIGEEAKACLAIIEEFNQHLLRIEKNYAFWFKYRNAKLAVPDKLQHHIHYHFEGGIAAFKFKDEDELPSALKNDCLSACKAVAVEHSFSMA